MNSKKKSKKQKFIIPVSPGFKFGSKINFLECVNKTSIGNLKNCNCIFMTNDKKFKLK